MHTATPIPVWDDGFWGHLTPAEYRIAQHVAQGLTNREIASALGKAEPTVKHQVASLFRKAGVCSRSRFVALYYQRFFSVVSDHSGLGRDSDVHARPLLPHLSSASSHGMAV